MRGADTDELTFGFLETESKPYKWKEGETYKGYFIDIFTEISRRTGLTFNLEPLPLKRVLYYVENGESDGCFGYYKTPEREAYATFLDVPISTMALKLYVMKDRAFPFERIEDLHGKTIGLLREQFVSDEFNKAIKEGNITAEYVNNYPSMLRLLQGGSVDAIVGVATILEHHLAQQGLSDTSLALPKILKTNHTWILVSNASENAKKLEIVEKMNAALEDMKAEGIFETLANAYGYHEIVVFEQ